MAPQYAGILLGIGNMVGNISGIVSPTITGYIVQNKVKRKKGQLVDTFLIGHLLQLIEEWRIVFFIAAGIYLISCAVYFFLCSGELQFWAKPMPNDTEMTNKTNKVGGKFYEVNIGFEDDKTV